MGVGGVKKCNCSVDTIKNVKKFDMIDTNANFSIVPDFFIIKKCFYGANLPVWPSWSWSSPGPAARVSCASSGHGR